MNKQEFLAISIFSNLRYLDDNNKIVELHCVDNGIGLVNFGWGDAKEFTNVKPILHPLSSLTKEIEHNGEKFVPYIELLRLSSFDIDNMTSEDLEDFKKAYSGINADIELTSFSDGLKLIEWHFDIAGLIEKGEAIDVNILPENPYK